MADQQEKFDAIAEQLATRPNTNRGQMFGKPSLSVNGNAFAAFHKGSMAFKLPEEARTKALALKGAELWDPSGKGRPMKEWVAVPGTQAAQWEKLAATAHDHIAKMPGKKAPPTPA